MTKWVASPRSTAMRAIATPPTDARVAARGAVSDRQHPRRTLAGLVVAAAVPVVVLATLAAPAVVAAAVAGALAARLVRAVSAGSPTVAGV